MLGVTDGCAGQATDGPVLQVVAWGIGSRGRGGGGIVTGYGVLVGMCVRHGPATGDLPPKAPSTKKKVCADNQVWALPGGTCGGGTNTPPAAVQLPSIAEGGSGQWHRAKGYGAQP